MNWFRKKGALTGVGAVLHSSHRPPHESGPCHDHVWEIVAWFKRYPGDAIILQQALTRYVSRYAGQRLPDRLSRGEALAADIARYFAAEVRTARCVRVNISRHEERLYARWPA